MASGAYHHSQVIEDKGLLFENTDETSNDFGAMYIGPGIFSIASDKKADGSWDWTTFGTGKGFIATLINAGILNADLIRAGILMSLDGSVHIDMETGQFKIGDASGNRSTSIRTPNTGSDSYI